MLCMGTHYPDAPRRGSALIANIGRYPASVPTRSVGTRV